MQLPGLTADVLGGRAARADAAECDCAIAIRIPRDTNAVSIRELVVDRHERTIMIEDPRVVDLDVRADVAAEEVRLARAGRVDDRYVGLVMARACVADLLDVETGAGHGPYLVAKSG